jgi:hypothetical protein
MLFLPLLMLCCNKLVSVVLVQFLNGLPELVPNPGSYSLYSFVYLALPLSYSGTMVRIYFAVLSSKAWLVLHLPPESLN